MPNQEILIKKNLIKFPFNYSKYNPIDFARYDAFVLSPGPNRPKDIPILKQILEEYRSDPEMLLKYSEEGILIFPAQPFVYFIKGKALNYQKKYKEALTTLENGIDFVIEDKMEVGFYREMAKSYKGLGNLKEEKKVLEKLNKLKS